VAAAVLGTVALLAGREPGVTRRLAVVLSAAAAPVLAVGIADDLRPVSISLRLGVHLLAGAILAAGGLQVGELTNPFGSAVHIGSFGAVVSVLWVATVINAMNLIDGLDGLAAGVGAIAALALSMVGRLKGERDLEMLGLVLAGAVAGFLPYNFPRARVFLGDVGSTFIGLVLAAASLVENTKTMASMTLLLPLVALGLPLLDTAAAVVRRAARRSNPMRRDLDHLHHRLLRLGLSPGAATGVLLVITALLGSAAVALAGLSREAALLLTAGLGACSLLGLAALRRLERRGRAS
jgi:UDP-GlcNAc:undecaprenyl-phosphate GlcNAc-1-phosphate transferase